MRIPRYVLRYCLYSQEELVDLIRGAGFTLLAAYGGFEGTPLGPDSPAMLVIARKVAAIRD